MIFLAPLSDSTVDMMRLWMRRASAGTIRQMVTPSFCMASAMRRGFREER